MDVIQIEGDAMGDTEIGVQVMQESTDTLQYYYWFRKLQIMHHNITQINQARIFQ